MPMGEALPQIRFPPCLLNYLDPQCAHNAAFSARLVPKLPPLPFASLARLQGRRGHSYNGFLLGVPAFRG